jgi:hypothetical protein
MASFDRLRQQGFRRWYERQLVECHAWLVTCFLGIIALASGIEVFGMRTGQTRLVGAALMVAGLVTSLFSWRRYRGMLAVAERLGERASCPGCGSYGRFIVLDAGPNPLPDGGDPDIDEPGKEVWFRAECLKCRQQWLI